MLLATIPHSGTFFAGGLIREVTGRFGRMRFLGPADGVPENYHLYWGHYAPIDHDRIVELMERFPLLSTLRDPVLSMMTYYRRWGERSRPRDLLDRLDGLLALHPFPLPVDDKDRSSDERYAMVLGWLRAGGAAEIDLEKLRAFTDDWEPVNRTPDDRLGEMERAYATGDLSLVERGLPDWDEFMRRREKYRPYLLHAGMEAPWF